MGGTNMSKMLCCFGWRSNRIGAATTRTVKCCDSQRPEGSTGIINSNKGTSQPRTIQTERPKSTKTKKDAATSPLEPYDFGRTKLTQQYADSCLVDVEDDPEVNCLSRLDVSSSHSKEPQPRTYDEIKTEIYAQIFRQSHHSMGASATESLAELVTPIDAEEHVIPGQVQDGPCIRGLQEQTTLSNTIIGNGDSEFVQVFSGGVATENSGVIEKKEEHQMEVPEANIEAAVDVDGCLVVDELTNGDNPVPASDSAALKLEHPTTECHCKEALPSLNRQTEADCADSSAATTATKTDAVSVTALIDELENMMNGETQTNEQANAASVDPVDVTNEAAESVNDNETALVYVVAHEGPTDRLSTAALADAQPNIIAGNNVDDFTESSVVDNNSTGNGDATTPIASSTEHPSSAGLFVMVSRTNGPCDAPDGAKPESQSFALLEISSHETTSATVDAPSAVTAEVPSPITNDGNSADITSDALTNASMIVQNIVASPAFVDVEADGRPNNAFTDDTSKDEMASSDAEDANVDGIIREEQADPPANAPIDNSDETANRCYIKSTFGADVKAKDQIVDGCCVSSFAADSVEAVIHNESSPDGTCGIAIMNNIGGTEERLVVDKSIAHQEVNPTQDSEDAQMDVCAKEGSLCSCADILVLENDLVDVSASDDVTCVIPSTNKTESVFVGASVQDDATAKNADTLFNVTVESPFHEGDDADLNMPAACMQEEEPIDANALVLADFSVANINNHPSFAVGSNEKLSGLGDHKEEEQGKFADCTGDVNTRSRPSTPPSIPLDTASGNVTENDPVAASTGTSLEHSTSKDAMVFQKNFTVSVDASDNCLDENKSCQL